MSTGEIKVPDGYMLDMVDDMYYLVYDGDWEIFHIDADQDDYVGEHAGWFELDGDIYHMDE